MSLMDRLRKSGTIKTADILASSVLFTEKDSIPTAVPALNIALSGSLDGGLEPGLTCLAGPSKHFKTGIGLILVKSYLDRYPDAVCLFLDSEYGVTPDYITSNGIDTNRVLHIPIEHIEQMKFDLVNRLEEIKRGDHVIIFIDSIGNLASKKEVEDALEEKSVGDMTRAKTLKSFFRIITPHLITKDIPCIAINHSYSTMEMYSKQVMGGGCMVAGTQIIMADGSLRNIEDVVVGDSVSTLMGPKDVTDTWNPDTLENGSPECFDITFEDGHTVTVSDKHKFLVDGVWVEARNLSVGECVENI